MGTTRMLVGILSLGLLICAVTSESEPCVDTAPNCEQRGQAFCNMTEDAIIMCRAYCSLCDENGTVVMTAGTSAPQPTTMVQDNNTTDLITMPSGECVDHDPACADYGLDFCLNVTEAVLVCRRHCDMCNTAVEVNTTIEATTQALMIQDNTTTGNVTTAYECVDQDDKCADRGPAFCNITEEAIFMCPVYCNLCEPSTTPTTELNVTTAYECVDQDDKCADRGPAFCNITEEAIFMCPVYCNLCEPSTTPTTELNTTMMTGDCVDQDANCANRGPEFCNITEEAMFMCPVYCNLCDTPTTPATELNTTMMTGDCVDQDAHCATRGPDFCLILEEAMFMCRAYCNLCNETDANMTTVATTIDQSRVGLNETSPEPTTASECFDQDQRCAERGIVFCQNVEEAYFMCRLYCELCNYTYTTPEATTLGVTTTPAPRCNLSAEVVFVLDASSSVGAGNFQMIRTFTENVTERLNIEYQILNVTVITFSNEAQLQLSITLSEPGDLAAMLSAESNITYTHGGTETHKALDIMQQAFNYDTNSPKIAIVVTDGASFEPDLTKQSAQNAKDNNVTIFVIGIGDDINQHETAAISSDPDSRYLYQLSHFNGLQSIVDEFHSHEPAVCPEVSTTQATTTTTATTTPSQPPTTTTNEQTPSTEPSTITTEVKTTSTPPPTTTTNEQTPSTEPTTITTEVKTTSTPPPTTTTNEQTPSTQPTTITTEVKTTSTPPPTTTTNEQTPSTQPTTITTEVKTTSTPPPTTTTNEQTPSTEPTTITTEVKTTSTPPPTTTTNEQTPSTEPTTITTEVKTTSTPPPTTTTNEQTPSTQPTTITTEVKTTSTPPPTTTTNEQTPSTEPTTITTEVKTTSTPPPTTTTNEQTPSTEPTTITTEVQTTSTPPPTTTTNEQTPSTEPTTITTEVRTSSTPPPTTTTNEQTPSTEPTTITTEVKTTSTPPPPTTTNEQTPSTEPTTITAEVKTTSTPPPTTTNEQTPSTQPTTITTEVKTTSTPPPTTTTNEQTPSTQPTTITTEVKTTSTPPPTTTTNEQTPSTQPTTITTEVKTTSTPPPTTTTNEQTPSTEPTTITTEVKTTSTPPPTTTTNDQTPSTQPTTITTEVKTTSTPPPTTTTNEQTPSTQPTTITTRVKTTSTPPPTTTINEQTPSTEPTTNKTEVKTTSTPSPTTTTNEQTPSTQPTTITTEVKTTSTPPPPTTTNEQTPSTEPTTNTTEVKTTSTPPPTTTTIKITQTTTSTCVAKAVDIVFVVDASGSIGTENFAKVKTFIKEIILTMDVDPGYTRAALIQYSTTANVEFKLNDNINLPDLLTAVDHVTYSNGGTVTSEALKLMMAEGFDGDRKEAPNVAVVITDGISRDPLLTKQEAEKAKQLGIIMFAIGVGNDTNKDELESIASSDQFVYEVGSYDALSGIKSTVANTACEFGVTTAPPPVNITTEVFTSPSTPEPSTTQPLTPVITESTTVMTTTTPEVTTTTAQLTTTEEPCVAKAIDIVFVVDASGSIGTDNFDKVKGFIKDILKNMDVDPGYTRAALIEYSSQAHLEFKLNDNTNLVDLLNAVDNVTYSSGGTLTSDALKLMLAEGFDGDRPEAPNVVVTITDGISHFPVVTRQQADLAKQRGITMFSIGIGNDTKWDELQALASSGEYVFQSLDYDALVNLTSVVANKACESGVTTAPPPFTTTTVEITQATKPSTTQPPTPIVTESTTVMTTTTPEVTTTYAIETTSTGPLFTTTPSCIAKVADVVFVVDASGSIGRANFDKVKQFIKEVIKTFELGYTRVALIEYSSLANIEFKLNENTNLTDLLDAVDHVNYSGGGTATSDALELMRLHGFDSERPLAPDVAIVITDGLSKYPPLTKIQASLAKQDGITLFSIGIGNDTVRSELEAIASSDKYVYEVGSYDLLFSLESVVAHKACGVALPEFYQNRSTTVPTTVQMGCFDLDDDCDSYHQDSCTDFEPYARQHCAKKCGYCTGEPVTEPPCEDTIDNCASYGDYVCYTAAQYEWVEAHCRKSCGFCGNKTEVKLTTPATPQVTGLIVTTLAPCIDEIANCQEYGGPSACTGSTEIWARGNCAKYCHYCYNYTNVTPPTVNNLGCPSWTLPEECTLEYLPGQCCPFPKCPDNFRLTVRRHLS